MGILKDMYDTFSMNLEKATEVEAVAQKNYESLIGVKENEIADALFHVAIYAGVPAANTAFRRAKKLT